MTRRLLRTSSDSVRSRKLPISIIHEGAATPTVCLQGIKHKPETTFGNVKADVLADKDPGLPPKQLLQCDP